jgi:hypothetical protein
LLLTLLLPAAFLLAPSSARSQTPALDDLRARAQEAEKRGDWAEACNRYDELLRRDRTQADARDGYQRCLRRYHLARRHHDPDYRAAVAALRPAEALDVYEQVLTVVPAVYVDSRRTELSRLFRDGLQEVRFALQEESFLRD